jgi:superfamily II DNA/RNA helicase
MKLTVEVDAKLLKAIKIETGEHKASNAVSAALYEFLSARERKRIINRFLNGKADYTLTNDQLEARDVYDARR